MYFTNFLNSFFNQGRSHERPAEEVREEKEETLGIVVSVLDDSITPRWLSLKSAAVYSSIGEARLISMAKAGEIKGFQDPDEGRHGWIFDRLSLDAYRESQARPTYRERALKILGSLEEGGRSGRKKRS